MTADEINGVDRIDNLIDEDLRSDEQRDRDERHERLTWLALDAFLDGYRTVPVHDFGDREHAQYEGVAAVVTFMSNHFNNNTAPGADTPEAA